MVEKIGLEIGKRYLVNTGSGAIEASVKEFTSNNEWVKLEKTSSQGDIFCNWEKIKNVTVIDVLEDNKPSKEDFDKLFEERKEIHKKFIEDISEKDDLLEMHFCIGCGKCKGVRKQIPSGPYDINRDEMFLYKPNRVFWRQ